VSAAATSASVPASASAATSVTSAPAIKSESAP
jgi:hypothetical protein